MPERNRQGRLTAEEKRIVKALLARRWRNQDIQALINTGREVTVNSGRITEVKQNDGQRLSSENEVEFFLLRKKSYDHQTGLNLFDDERLIRSREAMILAVQIFNSAAFKFKSEIFSVLSNIAWTYLFHEFLVRKRVPIIRPDGMTLSLSEMINRNDCPLTEGAKKNLRALKEIRDNVEHKFLGRSDVQWLGLFQACCLNFDKTLTEQFGEQLSLSNDLGFALQFAKMDIEQLSDIQQFAIPGHIQTLDARLHQGMTEDELNDLDYQFKVIYTLAGSSKSRAHLQFVSPDSQEGQDIRNVLVRHMAADHLYPFKPSSVVHQVRVRTGKAFTSHNHTQAWRLFEARPRSGSAQPENTNKDYCIYHPAHGDYTFAEKWIEKLVEEVGVDEGFERIKAVRIRG